jgi:Zn-dependent oligopeptidase
MQKPVKMKKLIKEELWKDDEKKSLSIEEKRKCMEAIRSYGDFGKQLNSESNLIEVAKKLSELAENATSVALSETEEWFDKNTVNRNMNELKTHAKNFQKVATDAQRLQERMQAMYEDMGHILSRYYDLDDSEISQPGPDGRNTTQAPEVDVRTQQPPIKESKRKK